MGTAAILIIWNQVRAWSWQSQGRGSLESKVSQGKAGADERLSQSNHPLRRAISIGIFESQEEAEFSNFFRSQLWIEWKGHDVWSYSGCPWSQEDWLGDHLSLFPGCFPVSGFYFAGKEAGLGPEPWHQNVFKCSHSIPPWLKDLGDQGHRTGGPLDNEPPGARTSHLFYLFIMCKFN